MIEEFFVVRHATRKQSEKRQRNENFKNLKNSTNYYLVMAWI